MTNYDYFAGNHLRLKTIVRLRWIAILGQLATVIGVYYGFHFKFPLILALCVIGLSIVINLMLKRKMQDVKLVGNRLGAWMIGYDIIQLTALLYLTGGIHNPFASLLVAPIAVSAASLRARTTIILGFLALAAATLIAFVHLPVPFETETGLQLPLAYRLGNWISVLCAMIFIGFFAWLIANESRHMSAALVATEATLAREQKLSAIDGLAAAAAHGLGTPLSTISLVAKELTRELEKDSPLMDDIVLIRSQALRCREILQSLADSGSDEDCLVASSTIGDILEEVAQPSKALNAKIEIIKLSPLDNRSPFELEPEVHRSPGMIYALGNLVENAVEYAATDVVITVSWSATDLKILICDDGPGFSPEMLDRLGEPFISRQSVSAEMLAGEQHGMGLGFFISKTLLERSGASITFGNRKRPEHGAYVQLQWPREKIDIRLSGISHQVS